MVKKNCKNIKKYYRKKRRYARKKANNPNYANLNTVGIPNKLKCRLRCTYRSAPITTGTFTTTNIYLNNAYNPLATVIGSQPMYYDQLMALYTGYKVIYVKVKFTIFNTSSTEPIDFCCVPNIANNSFSTMYQMREQKNAKYTYVGAGDGSSDVRTLYYNARMANIVANYNDSQFGTTTNGNPSAVIRLHYGYQNCDSSTAVEFFYDIEMIQTIIFSNPSCYVAQS